ncbi:hypothetical protein [Micromonospora sp. U21]|uniref:TolB family protein n=1 Tax=Micromonospora sp. U21 TaxID=2824899 RepID=UPI001B381F4F|nr:hypothetical protein [Micromonospora sp. U21]MBQ0905215.1 hypothetical protein [Micromonospora sp. U21]
MALSAPAATAADGTAGAVPTRVHDPITVAGHRELLDLTTGRQHRTLRTGVDPLAWSPDGQRVVGTRSNNTVISYGPDNQQLNDPEQPEDLLVVDPYRGTERVVGAGTFAAHAVAAWSPGGDLVAVAGPPDDAALVVERQRLVVVDPAGDRPRWQVDLGARRMLAGPGAWHPDGQWIALLVFDGCAGPGCTPDQAAVRTWRIEFLEAATGRVVGQPPPVDASTTKVVGWRGTDPVVQRMTDTQRDEDRRATLAVLSADGGHEVLLTAPDEATAITVPGDLLARAAFGGPERRPSPFAAPLWCYLALAVPLLLAVALLVRYRHRRRGSAADAHPGPDAPRGPGLTPRADPARRPAQTRPDAPRRPGPTPGA